MTEKFLKEKAEQGEQKLQELTDEQLDPAGIFDLRKNKRFTETTGILPAWQDLRFR